jgi:hypothetical protein
VDQNNRFKMIGSKKQAPPKEKKNVRRSVHERVPLPTRIAGTGL